MSLMLDALKRIEAKQAFARAPVSAWEETIEPPREDHPNYHETVLDSADETAGEDATASAVATVAVAAPPTMEPIDLPRDLSADYEVDLTPEEFALPGAVSLESAMEELSDLLVEVRLLDHPVPVAAASDMASLREELDRACGIGLRGDLEPPPAIVPQQSPIAAMDGEFALALSELCRAPDVALEQPPDEIATPDAAEVVGEPIVVNPLGSDPYAAAAWQILRQLQEGSSQVLLFTSPGDGHGKTTTLARLLPHVARSFSGSVLVVDANTRNPEMARRLEVAATWRLTDVLAGATHWMNAVRPTALPRVSLLPGGVEPTRRPQMHGAAALLRELVGHYDLLLVDATSLAHDGAAQLAAACDGTYLVVRLGEANRRTVRDAVRVLNRAGGRLLGCIAIDAGV